MDQFDKPNLDEYENLLTTFGSPLYVYFQNPIVENAQNFINAFKKYFPTFQQYFAVKATPNIHILEILKNLDMGFDCSSLGELELINQLVNSDQFTVITKPIKIMYTSNFTSVEDFEILLKTTLNNNLEIIINLDDIDGLENLHQASINVNICLPKMISFRLNPLFGPSESEVESNILGGADTKFGIPSSKIVDAYKSAINMGFTNFGIHMMTGSCVLDINYFKNLVDIVFEHIKKINDEVGIKFDFVDLGGGIGIPYKPNEEKINIELLAKTIYESINENKNKYKIDYDMSIYMENGRYITGPYGLLLTRCKSIKIGYNDKKFYGLDASMANLMRPGMYGAYHKITVPRLDSTSEPTVELANVVGTLCENNDWFAKNRELPNGIVKNDIFVIHDVGAHGYSMGFQYNNKLRSAEILINDADQAVLIRKKETKAFG